MTNAQRMDLVNAIYNLIFTRKAVDVNTWYQTPKPVGFEQFIVGWNPRTFTKGTLRGIDTDLNVDGKILSLRFLEQNPNKMDFNGNLKDFAIRARNGECIMWIIDKRQENGFLGSVQNGQFIPSQMRAYRPAQSQVAAAGASPTGFSSDGIPDIPAGTSNPQYVINTADGGQYAPTEEEMAAADAIAMEAMMEDFDPSAYDDEYIEDYPYEFTE